MLSIYLPGLTWSRIDLSGIGPGAHPAAGSTSNQALRWTGASYGPDRPKFILSAYLARWT